MIIFLSGSTNAGKTTVARILSEKIPQSTIVEIDGIIREFDHLSPKSRLENGIEKGLRLIEESQKSGFQTIVPFPLSQAHYTHFTARLQTTDRLFFFTLDPSLPVALSDRGDRKLTSKERERITRFYTLGLHQPSFGIGIDTSHHTGAQTAELILQCLKDDLGEYQSVAR